MKISLLSFIFLFSFFVGFGQCNDGDIILNTQEEVDNFSVLYGNCVLINVIVSGDDITDLTPLSDIVSIAGDLNISNNDQLSTIEGLENLFDVIQIIIENNPQLSDITAISNALDNDFGIGLIIRNNPVLETCSFVSMCNFLNTNVIEATIENNGIACSNLEEVLENCNTNLNIISGNILFDFDNDGCTTDDYAVGNILVETTDGISSQTSITDDQGNFSLFVEEGVYTTSLLSGSLPSIFQSVPEAIESTFEGGGNEDAIEFCVEAAEIINDISVTLIPLQEPRPGFDARYIISYSNLGSTIESGTITMNFDEEILFYENSSLPPTMISETSTEWEYNEMLPFETRTFIVIFELFIPPTVQGGEILSSQVVLDTSNTDDIILNNVSNIRELVVNSYDPNDKQVLQGERILEEEVGNYLDYVVRFQNTGTADAINVIVTDTLSDNLNWNTLRILSSSDDYRVEITNGNEVTFIFENINLPPEEQDEEGSNGHIAFQIRSNDDLVLDDVIENTANIFFDFNAPIITNTVVTTVSLPLSLEDNILQNAITIYPNPTVDILNITLSSDIQLQYVDVFSVTGNKVLSTQNISIDFMTLAQGIYFARIQTNQGTVVKKIVKK
ncbi:T9SS type A sorting domain-containing protein [Dokdonia ponticola]|uniref:T9SS type A sorting domain-containing protein n=1 Tax=Dokdonia ponticola TaxID=2041041 RepID=A0ABV9I1G5_9FLAO